MFGKRQSDKKGEVLLGEETLPKMLGTFGLIKKAPNPRGFGAFLFEEVM